MFGWWRCDDEMPAELSQHRLQRPPVSEVLGTHGGGWASATGPHRRRTYGAGCATRIVRSTDAGTAAAMRGQGDRGALWDEKWPIRSGILSRFRRNDPPISQPLRRYQ